MKKILLSILLVAVGLSVFSQPVTRILNMRPAYPLAVGETTVDNHVYAHNGLILQDIVQDSLPTYEIGHIFAQTVRYTEEGLGFYVKADSLHSNNVVYSIDVDSLPAGPIEFNSSTGRFKYYPAAEDYRTFFVTFRATNGVDTVVEVVEFNLMVEVVPEQYAFQSQGVMPNGEDYTIIASSDTNMYLNNENRTAYSYSISGKDIVFDNNVQNKVWGLSGREDIYELNIFAERLIIRSPLLFPQCNITIYAKEMIFEDQAGAISSINTTPSRIVVYSDYIGQNGSNAGNIDLYVKDFKATTVKRFILNGGNGQSTNRNGTPGNGGNGGTLTTNLDIHAFCDFARGSCGLKYNVDTLSSNHFGEIIGAGAIGDAGHFVMDYSPGKFLHPYYIAPVIRYVTDAYINNYINESLQICKEYSQLIEQYFETNNCDNCTHDGDIELKNDITELNNLICNLNLGLDYFGNPIGWAPLLSFEVMLANYQEEVNRAIPTLYLYYWLTKVDRTLEEWVNAKIQLANESEQNILWLKTKLNDLIGTIPILQDNISELQIQIADVNFKIEQVEAKLLAKARRKVKKQHRIKKAASICKAITSVASFCGPYGTAIAGAINTVSNVVSNVAYVTGALDINSDYASYFPHVDTTTYSLTALLDSVKTKINGLDFSLLKTDGQYLQNQYNSISSIVTPITNTVNDVANAIKHNSISDAEVKAVFDQLCANDKEWKSLQSDLTRLDNKKKEVQNQLETIRNTIPSMVSTISCSVIQLDAFRQDVFTNNSKRDLYAMQYLERMEQQAKNRLLKYHYYLRKAYEFRMLKPYEGEYNLVNLFERFENLATTLNYDSIVDFTNYAALSSVFDEVISGIAEEIIDEYSTNMPEQTAPITIVIPREQLDILNANEYFTLNFYEMGVFSPDEENVRIVDLGIQHIETHVVGNVGYSGYMDLNMTHQGISRFRKDGQIYWFDHMSRTTTNPHTWGIRYDAISNTSTNIQPSFASSSLLYSILGNNSTNIMLFSRPSAWGDINVSKKVHTTGGADIVIDSLVLRLQYDFTPRPANIRNIDITTNEGLLPYIACSEVDRNGRSNGNGNLNRSYNVSNQTVSFSAIERYGTWHFVNWTDRAGNIVSDTMDLTVNRLTDQFYRANYERRVPILSVPDTIFVNNAGGIYNVSVANVGSGDLEMDWYVSDSLSTWVHLNGLVEGIDNGYFSFTYENNENGSYRLDSLEIIAPETDIMSKMIYIVQAFNPNTCNLTASVTPSSVIICEGDTATITASGESSSGNIFSYSWNTGETTSSVNVLSGGERTVTVSDSNGCTATASVNVTVNPSPNLNISGNNSFCQGGSVSLIASGASSYSWSNGSNNATITISNPGTYTVIGTNATGCSATASKTVTVNPTYNIPLTESICQGETYNFNGQYLTTAGTYTQNLSTVNGCDSIITLTLTVKALPTATISGNTTLCQGQSTILTATGGVSYNWNNGYTSNNIPVSQSGIYTVTATNAEGCSATANVTVTVNPLPTVTITGNSTICQGSSTTLTATGANIYNWSTGDNTASVSINAFGIYTVTGTSTEGCSNTANVTVLVSQLPQITITGETDICAGESTTLTANGGDIYLWSNGSTDNTLTVNLAGIYQVIGYNAAGCSNMADATVSVWQPATSEFTVECPDPCYEWNGESYCQSGDYTQTLQTVHGCDSVVTLHLTITVGIEDHDFAAFMTVYPNPTNGIVNVQFTNHNSPITQIHVYDVYGKLVGVPVVGANDDSPLQRATAQIDLSRYANGVYFIKAVANGHVMEVRKVVKQ